MSLMVFDDSKIEKIKVRNQEKRDKKEALKSRILPGAISGATLGGYPCRCLHISA